MKNMKLITKFFITVIITTIITCITVITTIVIVLTNKATEHNHKCNWEECPERYSYSEFSNDWFIREMHLQNPEKTYKECDSILNINSKDTTIN